MIGKIKFKSNTCTALKMWLLNRQEILFTKTLQSAICKPSGVIIYFTTISPSLTHLLSSGVQPEQADKAADLQQEINKNSQASKQGECPHCRHVGQGSYRRQKSTLLSACDSTGNYDTFCGSCYPQKPFLII